MLVAMGRAMYTKIYKEKSLLLLRDCVKLGVQGFISFVSKLWANLCAKWSVISLIESHLTEYISSTFGSVTISCLYEDSKKFFGNDCELVVRKINWNYSQILSERQLIVVSYQTGDSNGGLLVLIKTWTHSCRYSVLINEVYWFRHISEIHLRLYSDIRWIFKNLWKWKMTCWGLSWFWYWWTL